jgi:hypothetical protein
VHQYSERLCQVDEDNPQDLLSHLSFQAVSVAACRYATNGSLRMSRLDMLAERQELSSNPLFRYFNDLETTQIAVDVD